MKNVRDLLAAHGTTFSDMHVTTSMCGPSRASILTGQYAHHTGVLENFGAHAYPAFTEESEDMPVWMPTPATTRARRQVHQRVHRSCRTSQDPTGLGRLAGDGQHPDGGVLQLRPQRQRQPRPLRQQAERLLDLGVTKKAVNFIHGARHPFFLYFAPVAPHLPAIPAPKDRGKLENIAPIHDPAFNQSDIGKEPWRYWHQSTLSAGAQLYINHVRIRQEETLLSLDERQKRRAGPEVEARAEEHRDPLHERQRLPLGRAPARRQDLAVRGVDARAARRPHAVDAHG